VAGRDWTVLLIGGTSATGKTTLGEAMAHRLDLRYIDLDLFWIVLNSAIPPEVEPCLHLFEPESIWLTLTPEELTERYLPVASCMCSAIEPLLVHHLQIKRPVVLEGAWLLPSFAQQGTYAGEDLGESVRSLFLVEDSREEIGQRIRGRHGGGSWFAAQSQLAQHNGIETQWLYGQRIKQSAEALCLPVLESRPFETLLERALSALGDEWA
jgi:2-phosphoglycerate kinase